MKGGKTLSAIGKIIGSSALGITSIFLKVVNDNAKKTQEILEETNEKRKSLLKKAGVIVGSAVVGFTTLYFKIISGDDKNSKTAPKKNTAKKIPANKTQQAKSTNNTTDKK